MNWHRTFIRTARVYLQSLVGLLGFAGASSILPLPEVLAWGNLFVGAAVTSTGPAVVTLIQNVIEDLGRLEGSRD